jgi:hypothetical protein
MNGDFDSRVSEQLGRIKPLPTDHENGSLIVGEGDE